MRRLGRAVLDERAEFTPAAGPVDQRDFTNVDAAEPDPHRQRDDVQALEQFVERRQSGWHPSIVPHTVARSRPSQYGLRSSFLRILPVGLRGMSSTKSTVFGHL
ncbi:Uncharacterised protein [Mycobacteroides abscessus subsp. abscessus]|nr:Uncharacterised protein [Mycobacteroides abscessus subsp. abscessus]